MGSATDTGVTDIEAVAAPVATAHLPRGRLTASARPPREHLLAVLGFLAAALVIFHPALSGKTIGAHTGRYAPFASVATPEYPLNFVEDVEDVFLPFLCHAEHELARGRVPLWTPYSGAGRPFLANQSSTAAHPFTLFALAAGWRRALLSIAFLRFALAYGGTWLLARDLGMSRQAATVASLSASLAGGTIVWLCYELGGVLCHLALILFLSRRQARRGSLATGALLTLVLSGSVVAGHMQYQPILWVGGALAGLGTLTRLRARRLAALALPFVTAAALTAPVLLPSVEYLSQSVNLATRDTSGVALVKDPRALAASVDGSLLRAEGLGTLARHGIDACTLGGAYVGVIATVLAAAALRFRRQRPVAMASLAVAFILCDHALARLLWFPPPFRWIAATRLVLLAGLGVSLMAGFAVDAFSVGSASLACAGTALTASCFAIAFEPTLFRGLDGIPTRSRLVSVAFGALALAALAILRRVSWRRHAWLLLAALLLLERLWALGGFTPWSRPECLFPKLPVMDRIARLAGHERIVAPGAMLQANTSTPYAIRDCRAYDGIGVTAYDAPVRAEGNFPNWYGTRLRVPSASSRAAAARLVLWPDGQRTTQAWQQDVSHHIPEIEEGTTCVQSFPAVRGDLRAIEIHFADVGHGSATTAEIELCRAGPSPTPVWNAHLRRGWIPRTGWKRMAVEPAIATDAGEELLLRVSAPYGRTGESFALSGTPRMRGRRLVLDGRPQDFALALRAEYRLAERDIVARGDGIAVTVDAEAPPRARLEREPHRREAVAFERDDAGEVTLRCRASSPDRLLLADTFYPGWRATVDGRPVALERDGAFRAVAVPAGEHVVTMRYLPTSYRIGLFMAALALLTGSVVFAFRNRLRA